MVKHLYVIGNGFDIFTGLNTRYSDFREWLKHNYIFVYEQLESVYNSPEIEWWNDFEVSLGKLDINHYIKTNTPPAKSFETIRKEIDDDKKRGRKESIPPSLYHSSPCARRILGLFDIVHYCMKKWIESKTQISDPKYIDLETEDSIFLNFNYTKTLELFYEIPQDRILHIHGCAYDSEKLVFGHNTFTRGMNYSYDGEKVCDVLEQYHKNPYQYIFKNKRFFSKIKSVKFIHVLGLSFSPVDIDYMNWIYDNTSKDVKWEVSWYSDEDKTRIANFVLDHWNLKNRCSLIKLTSVGKGSALNIEK